MLPYCDSIQQHRQVVRPKIRVSPCVHLRCAASVNKITWATASFHARLQQVIYLIKQQPVIKALCKPRPMVEFI
jgi:hypothetical protein